MKTFLRTHGFLMVASLLLAAAAIWTAFLPAAAAGMNRRLERKRQDLARLAELRVGLDRGLARRALYERLESPRPADPEAVLKAALPDLSFEIQAEGVGEVEKGWRWERRKIALTAPSPDPIFRLIAALEAQRPPWTVVAWSLSGGNTTGQIGQVRLTVESLIPPRP